MGASSATPSVFLKPGRDKPVRQRHPWIFSGAIGRHDDLSPGGIVDIRAATGEFLARGYANPQSKLVVRVLTWREAEVIDGEFWYRRLEAAFARRAALLSDPTRQNAARLVMSEADLLPGLIIDRYGDYLVLQALTAGIDRHLEPILAALARLMPSARIIERSDDAVRDLEGLPRVSRALVGGEPPADGVLVHEQGLSFRIDLLGGHKTGFYLDQRQNHLLIRQLAAGRKVLDCFAYTGGFTLNALAGGATHVTAIDASEPALARLQTNLESNPGLIDHMGGESGRPRVATLAGNAFELLRTLRDQGESFDLIALDPPKFAQNAAQIDKAARAYKDINLLALKLLRPGGLLATFSCSGHISADLFQKILFGAALDAGRDVQVLERLFQANDHPTLLSFPESLYLKGLLCAIL